MNNYLLFFVQPNKRNNHNDEDSQNEDDDGYLLTSKLYRDIQTGLHALQTNNPLIYDRKHSFIDYHNYQHDINQLIDISSNSNSSKQSDDKKQDEFLQQFSHQIII